jgi:cell wall-associated NlpC family hydrolase
MKLRILATTSKQLEQKAQEVFAAQPFMNCQLFVQQMTSPKFKEFKKVSIDHIQVGDIIAWSIRHYAIYLGSGQVIQVESWGEKPSKVTLDSLIREYDKPTEVYRPIPRTSTIK